MVMPNGITGVELAKILLKESQTLKILYISGYRAEVIENSGLTQGKAGADSFEQALFCVAKAAPKGVVAMSQVE
jgi:hypothetical protein